MFEGDPDIFRSESLGPLLPNILRSKTSNFWHILGQLCDLVVHISGRQQDIIVRKRLCNDYHSHTLNMVNIGLQTAQNEIVVSTHPKSTFLDAHMLLTGNAHQNFTRLANAYPMRWVLPQQFFYRLKCEIGQQFSAFWQSLCGESH